MITIDELIAEKGEMELAILKAVNEIRDAFEKKTGAAVQEINFIGAHHVQFNMVGGFKYFTDCECKIEYNGVKVGG